MSAIQKNAATVGTTSDLVNRLRAVMPPWFADVNNAPVLGAVLTGIGDAFSFVYAYLLFAATQTRINTATGGWLDLIAWDYFAGRFVRRQSESDQSFQPRILLEILRPRATRPAIVRMLNELTGRTNHFVREAWNTNDYGSYGTGQTWYGIGLGYGSLQFPNQVFIDAFRPTGSGIPITSGYGASFGGYGVGSAGYIDLSQISGQVTDVEIEQRIVSTVAAGTTVWLDIHT